MPAEHDVNILNAWQKLLRAIYCRADGRTPTGYAGTNHEERKETY
jgi:hypothetical protein